MFVAAIFIIVRRNMMGTLENFNTFAIELHGKYFNVVTFSLLDSMVNILLLLFTSIMLRQGFETNFTF